MTDNTLRYDLKFALDDPALFMRKHGEKTWEKLLERASRALLDGNEVEIEKFMPEAQDEMHKSNTA